MGGGDYRAGVTRGEDVSRTDGCSGRRGDAGAVATRSGAAGRRGFEGQARGAGAGGREKFVDRDSVGAGEKPANPADVGWSGRGSAAIGAGCGWTGAAWRVGERRIPGAAGGGEGGAGQARSCAGTQKGMNWGPRRTGCTRPGFF